MPLKRKNSEENGSPGNVRTKQFKMTEQQFGGWGKKDDKQKRMRKSRYTTATRKERKLSRKMQKPHFKLSQDILRMWEKLRLNKSKLSKTEREDIVNKLLTAIKEKDKKLTCLMYAHDTSRVLQSCLKQGSTEQRQAIYNELKSEIVNMSKNRYSKNMVWKLLKYGTQAQRDEIIHQFADLVPKLIRKQWPASVIEYAYNNYANKDQRNFLVHQFYGSCFKITKSTESATLEDVLRSDPEKKTLILANIKQCLVPLIDKQIMSHTIVHRVFNEFFMFCDEDHLRSELIEFLRESVIHILHTRDGAHVAMNCLWHGTAKDRKVIVKTMKEFIGKLCQEEYGHLVILAAFDSVDDTVFINKALVTPIVNMLPDLIGNKFARKVLSYLISPRSKSYFLPETIKFLRKGDHNKHSKKPMEMRHRELLQAAYPGLISYMKNNISSLTRDRVLYTLVEAACCQGDASELSSVLYELLSQPFEAGTTDEEGKMHIVEDPVGHLLIKHLVSQEKKSNRVHFGTGLLRSVGEEHLCLWCSCNRGSQVLLSLVRCPDKDIAASVKELLKKKMTVLEKYKHVKSTELLLQNLG